jgi:glutaredoxin
MTDPGRGAADGSAPLPDLIFYTRAGCHLCEDAQAVLRAAHSRRDVVDFALRVVDIDADPDLARRYGVRVPVVAIDGTDMFDYEVPPDLLARALGAAPLA